MGQCEGLARGLGAAARGGKTTWWGAALNTAAGTPEKAMERHCTRSTGTNTGREAEQHWHWERPLSYHKTGVERPFMKGQRGCILGFQKLLG